MYSDKVESLVLDIGRNACSKYSTKDQLFSQLSCRLAVTPYARTEDVRTSRLTLTSSKSRGKEVSLDWRMEDCFVRLINWRLEMWQSMTQYRWLQISQINHLDTGEAL